MEEQSQGKQPSVFAYLHPQGKKEAHASTRVRFLVSFVKHRLTVHSFELAKKFVSFSHRRIKTLFRCYFAGKYVLERFV